MELLLGTQNPGKVRELCRILSDLRGVHLFTHRERPFREVPETGATFRENALLKARAISWETGLAVLAEDAGLEVGALDGAPGVRSARFAGEGASDEENVALLLKELADVEDRRARFVCVAALRLPDGSELLAQGELGGLIAHEPRGSRGFGYDPVFIPEGFDRTLAELGPAVKDRISHRRKALERLKQMLLDPPC